MDLGRVLAATRRRWFVLVLLAAFGLLAGATYTALAPRQYQSTTTVFFSLSLNRGGSVSELAQGSTYTQDLVQSYTEVVTQPLVLAPVISRLGLAETPSRLARRIGVEAQPNTVITEITVTASSPGRAARIANEVGVELADAVAALSPRAAGSASSSITVTTLSRAEPPTSPSSPDLVIDLAVGLLAGLLIGAALVTVLEVVVAPVTSRESAREVTSAPVIGSIVTDPKASRRPLPVSTHTHLPRAEGYRIVRTNLRSMQRPDTSQSFVVTSSLPLEGRTSTAVNLAIAMSHTGQQVLLVDADLRRPAVARMLGIEGAPGLSTVLYSDASLDDVTQSWVTQTWGDSSLSVLTAGDAPPNPSELLASRGMERLLETVRNKYDVVILDSPPLLPVTDGALLSAQVDGALLVVNSRKTQQRQLAESVNRLQMAGASVLGVLLNHAPQDRHQYYDTPRRSRRR